jgi:DNA uptake protein ComE-like DNA-binding protein
VDPRIAALEARVAELSSSATSGIERSASERATFEGRVGELASSTVAGVERNTAELSEIEKKVRELVGSTAALEERITEIARSAVAGVERNASQLATIDTRLGEFAATAATAREHQGTELGSLQTRVGELAAFAEIRGEALGQRIDELERIVGAAEEGRSKAIDEVLTRLDSIEQRLSTMDSRLEGVEGVAAEVWHRDQSATEQARAAAEDLDRLKGIAKLNEASFEQLRTIGLSGTQAARLLAAREARSGFESVDELESIPGFPPALIAELKQLVES